MWNAATCISPDTGIRIIGLCFLPFYTKERLDGGYDISFQFRSNFGGLRKSTGLGLCLDYRKRDRQWVLKIKEPQDVVEAQLPIFISSPNLVSNSLEQGGKSLSLVKPNKHFLKQYHRSVFCKGGVLSIPLLLRDDQGIVVEGLLEAFPSVIKGKEYLVLKVSGVPVVVGR